LSRKGENKARTTKKGRRAGKREVSRRGVKKAGTPVLGYAERKTMKQKRKKQEGPKLDRLWKMTGGNTAPLKMRI